VAVVQRAPPQKSIPVPAGTWCFALRSRSTDVVAVDPHLSSLGAIALRPDRHPTCRHDDHRMCSRGVWMGDMVHLAVEDGFRIACDEAVDPVLLVQREICGAPCGVFDPRAVLF